MASKSPVTDIWSCHTWGGNIDILYTQGKEIGTKTGPIAEFDKILQLNDTGNLVNPILGKEKGDRTKWSLGPHDQFGITAFLCEGSGGIRTIEKNKQTGAVIIKSLSEFYSGTRTGKTPNTPD